MERPTIIAANWKMHTNLTEGLALAESIIKGGQFDEAVQCILNVPFIHLPAIVSLVQDIPYIFCGAQNCHFEDSGAFTGEISPAQLAHLGVDYVIIGHSERRALFGETDEFLAAKAQAVLHHGMGLIFCCGEGLDDRRAGRQKAVVKAQLENGLFPCLKQSADNFMIAYEPVWAIGTGETATPEQAREMHTFIRQLLCERLGEEIADRMPILYGGSVKPDNAASLFAQKDVDGGLIGGASLHADSFLAIAGAV